MALTFNGPYSLNPSQTLDVLNSGPRWAINVVGFQVGSNRYYITEAVSGSESGGQNTGNIWIQKSIDDGATWTNVYDGPNATFNHCVVLKGSILYIFGENDNASNTDMWVFRFDTSTDTMLDAGTDLGVEMSAVQITASLSNTGKIAVCYGDATTIDAAAIVLYDPVANTINAPVALVIDGSPAVFLLWQLTDPVTGIIFAGLFGDNLQTYGAPSSAQLGIIVVAFQDNGTEIITISDPVIAALYELGLGSPNNWDVTTPVIANGTLYVAYRYFSTAGGVPNQLAVTFSSVSLSLTFNWTTPELLFDPTPSFLWVFENNEFFGWGLVADSSNTVYAFYSVNVSFDDDSASQTFIYYQSRLGSDSWSTPVILFTGPSPSSAMAMYPSLLSGGTVALWAAYVDPVLYFGADPNDQYDSLTVLYWETGSPTPPATKSGGLAAPSSFQVLPGPGAYCRYKLSKPTSMQQKLMKVGKGTFYPRNFVR